MAGFAKNLALLADDRGLDLRPAEVDAAAQLSHASSLWADGRFREIWTRVPVGLGFGNVR